MKEYIEGRANRDMEGEEKEEKRSRGVKERKGVMTKEKSGGVKQCWSERSKVEKLHVRYKTAEGWTADGQQRELTFCVVEDVFKGCCVAMLLCSGVLWCC